MVCVGRVMQWLVRRGYGEWSYRDSEDTGMVCGGGGGRGSKA